MPSVSLKARKIGVRESKSAENSTADNFPRFYGHTHEAERGKLPAGGPLSAIAPSASRNRGDPASKEIDSCSIFEGPAPLPDRRGSGVAQARGVGCGRRRSRGSALLTARGEAPLSLVDGCQKQLPEPSSSMAIPATIPSALAQNGLFKPIRHHFSRMAPSCQFGRS